jgi:sugar phosphate isomerase/epimerase
MASLASPIRSAVTISLVNQARGGPFVYWDELAASMQSAAALGFDAVELFLPGPEAGLLPEIKQLCQSTGLQIAAVGTGAGWVIHQLSLTAFESPIRERARLFIQSMIDFGAEFGAPAIIGSMQGRSSDRVPREAALRYLADALNELGQHAAQHGLPLLYEPLNRYETNLHNQQLATADWLRAEQIENVQILADLFHMNIEEQNLAEALRSAGAAIGHIHFVDSNRRAAGFGHTDFEPIAAAIRDIGYTGYLSAEAFAWPNSEAAAQQTIQSIRQLFSN